MYISSFLVVQDALLLVYALDATVRFFGIRFLLIESFVQACITLRAGNVLVGHQVASE